MSTNTTVGHAVGTAVLAGAAVFAAAPAYAGPIPVVPPAATASSQLNRAQIEHDEGKGGRGAQLPVPRVPQSDPTNQPDPSSVSIATWALFGGGGLVAGTAGFTVWFTVHRRRHQSGQELAGQELPAT